MVRPQAVNHQDPGTSPASERQCSQISVPSRRVLPARIGRTQPEEDLTGRLIMRGERSIVLDDHMNVAEMPLQRIAAVYRVRSRGVEYQIDCANGFVHSVG